MADLHNIFVTDPLKLFDFVDRFVQIQLENGEILTGVVYTIDPVSQSIVLLNKDKSEELSLQIILNHSVSSLEILPDIPDENRSIIPNISFRSEKFVTSDKIAKEEVKNWLLKNMIPVTEIGDKLLIDTLEIHPPYGEDQCYCDNAIVLARIQTLLRQMPSKSS